MKNQNSEISNKDNLSELIDTLNKVICDVNLLMEKVKNLEEFKNFADKEIFQVRADDVDLKADDVEMEKTLATISKEVKDLERGARKLEERVNKIEEKTKSL
ncbi:MAG: hypothetical protein KGJ58_02315 [Patescibacteria group bacterium]|nr:hypothetical protein [Patescibacteria group bacterium]MDE1988721.1 hypothetical protein [Patescibacteria group bacterium]MDE2218261.1 hypothetical protein [Patescibacteria group bacterium]